LAVAFAALGVLALPARAQDPPPEKTRHENVVTPEAKAAIDRFNRLVYVADRHGLRSCAGVLVPVGFASDERSPFEWKPPGLADLRLAGPVARELSAARLWAWAFRIPVYLALHPDGIFDYAEFDARIAHEQDGLTTLAVTEYEQGSVLSSDEFVFDREGLLTKRVHGVPGGSTSQAYTATYTYAKVGDAYCLAGMQFTAAKPSAARYVCTLRYAEVAGFHLLESYDVTVLTEAAVRRKFTFRVADLAVNGESVALLKSEKHVNRVTPEARAALDRHAGLVYRASDQGLRTATATLLPNRGRVEVEDGRIRVTASGAPDDPQAVANARFCEFALGLALSGPLLVERREFDAEFVDRSGRRVLAVTEYDGGAVLWRKEAVLDHRGLVVSLSVRGPEAASPQSEYRFGWRQMGDRWQVQRFELWESRAPAHYDVAFTFADAAGMSLPASLAMNVTNVGPTNGTIDFALSDLVVNGKPVALPKSERHANVVTPEAQKLLDAYRRAAYAARYHGLVTASGVLVVATSVEEEVGRFSYCFPGTLRLTLAPNVKAGTPQAQAVEGIATFALLAGFGQMGTVEGAEYDARVSDRDGRKVLEMVECRAGVRTATVDMVMNAAGLPGRIRRREGADPDRPTDDFVIELEWEPAGEESRIRTCVVIPTAAQATRNTYALRYAVAEGILVPIGFDRTYVVDGETHKERWRFDDLVVNGKKVALPKPDAQPAGGGK
jgi:hypothetical protein